MGYNVAIDGPAGAGKSTIAKQVANYNLCSWIPFAGANTASDDTVNEYTVRSAYRQALILQYPVTNLKSADFSTQRSCG